MAPRTERIPKVLLPVAGRPFAHHLLGRLVASGFREVLFCVGHLGGMVREALGDGASFGAHVTYADDGPALLGTAGALRRAVALLPEVFLVTYGDSYLPFDYASPLDDLAAHPEALGTMAVYRNEGAWDVSNTQIEGDRVIRYHKQRREGPLDPSLAYIDYGATALRRSVVEALPEGRSAGLDEVQRDLAKGGKLRAVEAAHRFYEIGSPGGLDALEAYLGGERG